MVNRSCQKRMKEGVARQPTPYLESHMLILASYIIAAVQFHIMDR